MADYFVSKYGSDTNDGLSWATAKKSMQGIWDTASSLDNVYVKGFFNEDGPTGTSPSNLKIYGDKRAQFSGVNLLGQAFRFYSTASIVKDIDFYNFQNRALIGFTSSGTLINCTFTNCLWSWRDSYNDNGMNIQSLQWNLINNCTYSSYCPILNSKNNTFHNVYVYIKNRFVGNTLAGNKYGYKNEIFSNCDIDWTINKGPVFSLFLNCRFKFTGEGAFTYPTGATDDDKIIDLRNRMVTAFGGVASDYMESCKYYSGSYNDIFVDADNGDFNLIPNIFAAHMSYEGDYIGARAEGHKFDWNTDFTNIVNIGTPGYVTDQNIDSSAETNILDIGHVRTILNFYMLGRLASRNGQYLNISTNLGSTIFPGSSVLTNGKTYICLENVITLNDSSGTSKIPFETFTAVDEGGGVGLGFSGDGVVKEILIENLDYIIQFKTSKTDPTLASATLLTGYLSSDKIYVNVDEFGEPTFGDADVGFDEGTAVELTTRYIKFFIKIKSWDFPIR